VLPPRAGRRPTEAIKETNEQTVKGRQQSRERHSASDLFNTEDLKLLSSRQPETQLTTLENTQQGLQASEKTFKWGGLFFSQFGPESLA